MRVGVYLGAARLMQLGGMGVYLQNLLQAVVRRRDSAVCMFDDDDFFDDLSAAQYRAAASVAGRAPRAFVHPPPRVATNPVEIVLFADRQNRDAAAELGLKVPLISLDRPALSDLRRDERRRAIAVRALSYRDPVTADAQRGAGWSSAAEQFLWGLDEAVAASGVDLLYFPFPPYLKRPAVPVLLTIHDAKHLHRPQDHARDDLARRRRWGRVARAAALTYSSYEHVRADLVEYLGVAKERTAVLPLATPDVHDAGISARASTSVSAHASTSELANVSASSRPGPTSSDFLLMPAQLWVHKNHALVLLALAALRREAGLNVRLVCTGQIAGECAEHATRMHEMARHIGVGDLVEFRGHVSRNELLDLYRRARAVIVASLYEAGSFPAMEALALGKPLAAAAVTSIPETVGPAARLFDPGSVSDCAAAIRDVWENAALRARLTELGPLQITPRTWDDVASGWIALCKRALSVACRGPRANAEIRVAGLAG